MLSVTKNDIKTKSIEVVLVFKINVNWDINFVFSLLTLNYYPTTEI